MADNKLNELLSRSVQKPEPDDAEDLGQCASRPVVKYVPAFHVKGRDGARSFDYHHMGLKKYEPTRFVIEFQEPEHWRLTVEGRNLWEVYNYLVMHRLEWITAADRDFEDGRKPVITRITVEKVEEETGD